MTRAQVRATRRHGGGFLIVGRDTAGRSIGVFTKYRTSADRIAAQFRADDPDAAMRAADFLP